MRIHRFLLPLLAAFAMLLATMPTASASSSVGAPWITAATTTSITLDWPSKKKVSKYRVYYATSYSAVKSKKAKSKVFKGSAGKVTKLKPNTMYCFQVAKKSGANRSQRYCHMTMRVANKSTNKAIGVATFNICGYASSCKSWTTARENQVVNRIKAASAHVVNIQEGYSRISRLEARLAPLGFALASDAGTEAVFYKTNTFEPVSRTVNQYECWDDVVIYTGDTTDWDKSGSVFADGEYWWWSQDREAWDRYHEKCGNVPVEVPAADKFVLNGNYKSTAAWATLELKSTGKTYTFVAAHLTSGKSAADDRARAAETRSLISQTRALSTGTRAIYSGDFNSNRSRATDAPRLEFAKHTISDSYDRASSYKNARYNSFNGWDAKPRIGTKYGDHVDRIFAPRSYGASNWQSQATFKGSNYLTPHPSDHNLIRATLWLG